MNPVLLIFLTFLGFKTGPVNDLRKQPTREDYMRSLNCWVQRNFGIVALTTIIILLIVFIIVCSAIVGVSAVESGNYHNHLMDVI